MLVAAHPSNEPSEFIMEETSAAAASDTLIFHSNPFPLFFRVRKVTTDGRLSLMAGRVAECNCLDASCPCYDPGHFLASNVHFSAISAITVTPDSVLTIADQGNYRLRSLSSGMLLIT